MANNVGRNIRTLRTRAGLTQDELAEKLFVSRQTVSNYETGRSQPDVDTLVRLAAALGTDVGTLIYGPAVPAQKKRQLLRCALGTGCLILWGVLSFPLADWLQAWRQTTYIVGFSFLLLLLAQPLFFITAGWLFPQLMTLFGAKQPRLARRRLWHGLTLGLGVAYLLWVLPICVETTVDAIRSLRAMAAQLPYSCASVLPGWLYIPAWFFSWHKPLFFGVMFVLGAALWLTAAPPKET